MSSAVVDSLHRLYRPGMSGLRQRSKHIRGLVEPAPLLPGGREHVPQRCPEAERTVAHGQHRGPHPTALGVPQQPRPRLGGLPVPIGQRDELLPAVGSDTDHHQQAQFSCSSRTIRWIPSTHRYTKSIFDRSRFLERLRLVLPLGGQPGHRRRGQPGPGTEELLNAGVKSNDDNPCKYSNGNTSATFGDFRDHAGRIFDENRCPHRFPG